MFKKTMIAAALVGAAMLAFAGSASAGKGGKLVSAPTAKHAKFAGHKQGFKFAHKKRFKLAHKRRFRHGYGYHGHWNVYHYRPYRGCHWLKRKARWTGKRYWWKRYRACRAHNYYAY